MNVFFGKRFLVYGIIKRKDLDDKIHYYGGSVINFTEHKLLPADFVIEGDESHAEEINESRKAGIHVINEYTVSCWFGQLNFHSDIIPEDRLSAYKEIIDVKLFNKGGRESFHEIRSMAKELAILRAEKANRDLPPPPAEVIVEQDLEIVPSECLDKYCEISDLDTIFLYEVRKIAREAKRARRSLSAKRWDALVSSPAIRILGSANVKEGGTASGYAHFGMEIWSLHSGRTSSCSDSVYGREILEKYTDIMIRNNTRAEGIQVTIDYPKDYQSTDKVIGAFVGNHLHVEIPELELDAILNASGVEQRALLMNSMKERGINTEVILKLTK